MDASAIWHGCLIHDADDTEVTEIGPRVVLQSAKIVKTLVKLKALIDGSPTDRRPAYGHGGTDRRITAFGVVAPDEKPRG